VKTIISILLPFLTYVTAFAQINQSQVLFNTLKTNDSLLFEVGFNTCDLEQFEHLLSQDFEFYHDEAGITDSKTEFIQNIREKIYQSSYKPIRRLVEGSMEVYALEKNGVLYGAIQSGKHEFYAIEKQTEYLTSVAKFLHVWQLDNNTWQLSRVYSYDHKKDYTSDSINKKLLFKDREETEKWLARHNIPALGIGYIKDGTMREIRVYGKLEKTKIAPVNTIFNVASLTKPVTALIALKLINAGEWSLDTPLFRYWTDPDIADDPRNKLLTTRHILSHQSGFPNWRYKNADNKLAFEFEPGTKYQYSGEGFEYLRRALEKHFSRTLDQLASELIFEPLQMYDTHFYWSKEVDEARFAKWHDEEGKVYKTYKNTSANAADDLLTTVADYCRFMIHVMEGAGLSPELYKEMISMQTQVKQNQHFGLGWLVDKNIGRGEYAITHGGDDKGVHTIAFMLPKSNQGLVIFTNGDNGVNTYIETILFYLGDLGQGIIDVETK
jgi:CubicO group peptidase (beta-lactamase class C family)